MLESSHPTLPPNGSAPDMQQAVMTDFKPVLRQGTWSCLPRKSHLKAFLPQRYNNHKPEALGIPLIVLTDKKHWKSLVLTDATSPAIDGDCLPQKNSKTSQYGLHNAHFIPKKSQNAKVTPKATNKSTKGTQMRKWGNVRWKRTYQENVY